MKTIFSFLTIGLFFTVAAQEPLSYVDKSGQTHLAGPIEIEDLQSEAYESWFEKSYEAGPRVNDKEPWIGALQSKQVDIYLGTWCGDSKRWVPQFIRLWDELGLDREQLNIIALYNGTEKYKQGPNGEEEGLKIHRVPTFIFRENNEEYARMVEYPSTDLLTDVAQIALGYPPAPSYKGANYLLDVFENHTLEEIESDLQSHFREVYYAVKGSRELNTLGYVLLHSNRKEQALVTFQMNARIYPYNPNVYDSLGEAYEALAKNNDAIESYQQSLALEPNNEHASERLQVLQATGTK